MLITPSQSDSAPKELRQLKYLTGVDVELKERRDLEPGDAADREKGAWKMWKRENSLTSSRTDPWQNASS